MTFEPSSERKRSDAAAEHMLAVPFEAKFASGAPAGTFSGYASVFGNVDSHGDVVAKGAFDPSLREWKAKGKLPKMLLQHGGGIFGGTASDVIPIGQWTAMEEDPTGLKVEGQLFALDTDLGKRVHAAMKAGELDGLSIGCAVKEAVLGTKPGEPRRTIKRLDLFEVSVVLFGSNDRALVDNVKTFTSQRDFEAFLHHHRVPKAAATKLASGGWPALAASKPNPALAGYLRRWRDELKKG